MAGLVRHSADALRSAGSVVRRGPFDTATVEGRSRERYRRIALTSLSSVGLRGVSMVAKLLIVPLAIGTLGTERYGLLVAISSLAAWLSLADFGIGNGLRNFVADASGRDDRDAARRYVASAYLALAGIAALLAVAYTVAQAWIPWPRVFNVESADAVAEVGPAMAVFVGCVLLSLPLTIGTQVRAGYQEGFVTNWCDALGSVAGLVGIVLVTRGGGGLTVLVAVIAGTPLLALLVNNADLLARSRPWLRPRLRDVRARALRQIGRTGVLFFLLQVGAGVVMFTDSLVVAQLFGAAEVARYAVPWQLFSALTFVVGLVLAPFWPAYTEAVARGDGEWVARTLRRSFVVGVGASLAGVAVLVPFGPQIVRLWVGDTVAPSYWLLASFGLVVVISTGIGSPIGMLLNGLGRLRFQLVWIPFAVTANLVLSVLLGRWIGLPGVALGTAVAELVFGVLPFVYYVPKVLASLRPQAPAGDAGDCAVGAAPPLSRMGDRT